MASGYVRQAAGNIASSLAIRAADLNAEYNQLQSAFDNTTGHDHSGSVSGDGAKIPLASAVSGVLPVANGGSGSATSYLPCPNILINPAMEIDQINEGASISVGSGLAPYGADQWTVAMHSATAVVTSQRVADAPSGYTNSLKLTVSTGAAVAAGDYLVIGQPIEANNITGVAFGTASAAQLQLSFWVKSSIGTYTMSGAIKNAAGTRSYPFNVSITAPATWEQKFVSITADTAGVWVTSGTANGASLTITAAAGSTFQGTVNTWAAGNFFATSSTTNTLLSTNGATFQITGVKLEIAAAATAYTRRSIGDELLLCQRYYEKSYDIGVAVATATTAGEAFFQVAAGGSAGGFSDRFKATKRVTPTITLYSPATGTSGKVRDNVNAADVTPSNTQGFTSGFLVQAAPSAGTNIQFAVQWVADARL